MFCSLIWACKWILLPMTILLIIYYIFKKYRKSVYPEQEGVKDAK